LDGDLFVKTAWHARAAVPFNERKSSSPSHYVRIARVPAPVSLRTMSIGNG
jgi:hypothetical protein